MALHRNEWLGSRSGQSVRVSQPDIMSVNHSIRQPDFQSVSQSVCNHLNNT